MGTAAGNYGRAYYSDPKWKKKMSEIFTLQKVTVEKTCPRCKEIFIVLRSRHRDGTLHTPHHEHLYCSTQCAHGRPQSPVTREKIKKSRGRKERHHCLICGRECNQPKNKFCSRACQYKFQKVFSQRNLSEKRKYHLDCSFTFSLSDFPKEFDFDLIKQYGWYKAKNRGDNQNGVSRDHMISVDYGFKHNIPTKLISHPANCKLVRHTENKHKGTQCSLTLEQLEQRIKKWDEVYKS
jgi:hypothetical protein